MALAAVVVVDEQGAKDHQFLKRLLVEVSKQKTRY
jgi:hypothetical protein